MPRIFKENKFALLIANVLAIALWIFITTILKNSILSENLQFYIYKIADLIRFLPPIWVTYYLWIIRKNKV